MLNAGLRRISAAVLLTTWIGVQSGCCQHYCRMHAGDPCGPMAAQPSTVRYGSVCESPGEGTIISGSSRAGTADNPRPKIVVSRPGSGNGWKRAEQEDIATTRVEGALDDDSRNR